MTDELRRICETKFQGCDEKIKRSIKTTNWDPLPSNPVVKIYNLTTGTRVDVSESVLDGSPQVINDIIILPTVQNLVVYNHYRMEIMFDCSNGDRYEGYFEIIGVY